MAAGALLLLLTSGLFAFAFQIFIRWVFARIHAKDDEITGVAAHKDKAAGEEFLNEKMAHMLGCRSKEYPVCRASKKAKVADLEVSKPGHHHPEGQQVQSFAEKQGSDAHGHAKGSGKGSFPRPQGKQHRIRRPNQRCGECSEDSPAKTNLQQKADAFEAKLEALIGDHDGKACDTCGHIESSVEKAESVRFYRIALAKVGEECCERKCKAKIKKALSLYEVSKVAKAFKLSESVRDSQCLKSLPDEINTKLRDIDTAHTQMELAREILRDDDDTWTTIVDDQNEISTFHRSEADGKQSLKLVGTISAPMRYLMSLLIEADLIPSFINVVKIECEALAKESVYHQVLYGRVHLPWPLLDRDVIIEAHSFDLLEESGEIIVFTHSVESYKNVKFPPVPNGVKRRELPQAAARIRPISMNKAEFSAVGTRKFHTLVASKVVSLCARFLGYHMFSQFRKKAERGSKDGSHRRRLEQKRSTYDRVMKPIEAFFEKKEEEGKVAEG